MVRMSNAGYGNYEFHHDTFSRMLTDSFHDHEEVRFLKPPHTNGTCYAYMGLAINGASVSDPVWSCIRQTWEEKKVVRLQYRTGVAWDAVTVGWI